MVAVCTFPYPLFYPASTTLSVPNYLLQGMNCTNRRHDTSPSFTCVHQGLRIMPFSSLENDISYLNCLHLHPPIDGLFFKKQYNNTICY